MDANPATEPADRDRRRYLPAPLRHLLIAVMGALIAGGVFYLLRRLGY